MSINNALLKESMNECFKNFIQFYKCVHTQTCCLLDLFNNKDDLNIYEEIEKCEKQTNNMYRKNVANIDWCISQQSPIGNNLRFFLTVLLSLKDLERCGDYVYSIAKMIKKNNLLNCFDQYCDWKNIWQKVLNKVDEMWDIFMKNPKKISDEDFENIKKLKTEFVDDFKTSFQKTNLEILENIKTGNQKDLNNIAYVYWVVVKIDRTVDHIFNVIENFYYKDRPRIEDND